MRGWEMKRDNQIGIDEVRIKEFESDRRGDIEAGMDGIGVTKVNSIRNEDHSKNTSSTYRSIIDRHLYH